MDNSIKEVKEKAIQQLSTLYWSRFTEGNDEPVYEEEFKIYAKEIYSLIVDIESAERKLNAGESIDESTELMSSSIEKLWQFLNFHGKSDGKSIEEILNKLSEPLEFIKSKLRVKELEELLTNNATFKDLVDDINKNSFFKLTDERVNGYLMDEINQLKSIMKDDQNLLDQITLLETNLDIMYKSRLNPLDNKEQLNSEMIVYNGLEKSLSVPESKENTSLIPASSSKEKEMIPFEKLQNIETKTDDVDFVLVDPKSELNVDEKNVDFVLVDKNEKLTDDEKQLADVKKTQDMIYDTFKNEHTLITEDPKKEMETSIITDILDNKSLIPKPKNGLTRTDDIVDIDFDDVKDITKPALIESNNANGKVKKVGKSLSDWRKVILFATGAIIAGTANIVTANASDPIIKLISYSSLGLATLNKLRKNKVKSVENATKEQTEEVSKFKASAKKYLKSELFLDDVMAFSGGLLLGGKLTSIASSVASVGIETIGPDIAHLETLPDAGLPEVSPEILPEITPEITPEIDTYDFDEVILGNGIEGSDITSGYTNSASAIGKEGAVDLAQGVINDGTSVYERFVIVDDSGAIVEQITTPGITLEDLVNQGYNADNIAIDIRNNEGDPRAWVSVEDLGIGRSI